MALIVFSDTFYWKVGRWVLRRFLEDLSEIGPLDDETREIFEQASCTATLSLKRRLPNIQDKIVSLMEVSIPELTKDLSGKNKKGLDEPGYQMYLESLSGLYQIIKDWRKEGSR